MLWNERERSSRTIAQVWGKVVPFIIPSLSPSARQHAVKTQHGSMLRCPAPFQGSVAVQRESKCPGRSLVHVDRSAELLTAMPIQCLPLNLPRFISCPLPSPYFQGGVTEPRCQHVMSLPIVWRNDDQLYLEKKKNWHIEDIYSWWWFFHFKAFMQKYWHPFLF